MQCFYLNYHHSAFPRRVVLCLAEEISVPDNWALPNNCLIANMINRSLNMLVLLKTKFNASKKRIKQIYEMRYMPVILP